MLQFVVSNIRFYRYVVWGVVGPVAIYVVDYFPWSKVSADLPLRNQTMFVDIIRATSQMMPRHFQSHIPM
jgi:hypothetical protein